MEVLIVDSSTEITSRLKELLSDLESVIAIYEANTIDDAIKKVQKIKPGIVIIEVNLSQKRSLDAVMKIKTNHNEVVIIALSSRDEIMDILHYRPLGIKYFFDKYHEFKKIPETIHSITQKK